jgi:hypothetical protein
MGHEIMGSDTNRLDDGVVDTKASCRAGAGRLPAKKLRLAATAA